MPNEKFPDMKAMYDHIHSLGLRGGIYSTPMITAWGCPVGLPSIPGCTRGEPDFLNTNEMGGIGKEHMEANNVRQWEEWGVDYLKYDWRPTDPATADYMKKELLASPREIAFCVTVNALEQYGHYWKKNCTSWRDNRDSIDKWHVVREILDSVRKNWKKYVCRGHFFDLDMLEIGHMHWNRGNRGLTETEELSAYSMRAFFLSPIQLSCRLENLTEYEFDMICNEEILAIHQDALCDFPENLRMYETARPYRRRLENGDVAYIVFNMTRETITETLQIGEVKAVRNPWAKENLPCASNISVEIEPHGVCVLRVTPA
jgi:alpha-galactosidase